MSYTKMCLDSCGSLCVQIGRGKAHSDHQNPKKVALHGKTAYVGLHPQLSDRFTPLFLQWCLYYKDSITPKGMWFGNVGGQILCWKIGFTPQAIRHFCQNRQHSSSGAISSYLWELSLIVASPGHRTQFTFQKYPCLGPQMTTLVKYGIAAIRCLRLEIRHFYTWRLILAQIMWKANTLRHGLKGQAWERR
jgi:hypothetical protein